HCESDPVKGGRFHYVMIIPEYGEMAWHGTYTGVARPDRIDADEWFVMGGGEPEGPPSVQTLTFEPVGEGHTRMTMDVRMPEAVDPDEFMEQSAAGLGASLAAMDELVSG
ncbi:MAG: SRPBCC domain-containing protein, partial [Acidimicrobiia bacterium]|nr:SRPBCC domain-containing protein [Acidimicrobiia bacterium]